MLSSRAVATVVSLLALSSSSLAALAGCSGAEAGIDLTSSPPDGTQPIDPKEPADPPVCSARAAVCDPGDDRVASEAACKGADYCYSRAGACGGDVVWCAHQPAQCGAVPSCDAGDRVVTSCPKGATCYSRTACGSTLLCAKAAPTCKALPTCDAGDVEVKFDECTGPGAVACYSRSACNFTIWCVQAN